MSEAQVKAVESETDTDTSSSSEEEGSPVIRDVTEEGAEETKNKIKFSQAFTLTHEDDDGNPLFGRFLMKRLTIGEIAQAGVYKAELNGGHTVDGMTEFLHEMLSITQFAIVKFPEWWKPVEFYDGRILRSVYDHWRAYQNSFRK